MFSGGQPVTSMPRCRPICASTSLISFSDFRPKFGGAQHLGLGLLDEVADVDDVVVLQAVRRADGEFEFVDLLEQRRIEGELGDRRGGLLATGLLEVHEHIQLILKNACPNRRSRPPA